MARERVYDHLDEFVDGVEAWRIAEAIDYDLIHAHYWLSGVVALTLHERWSVPVLQMFHTLGRLKNRVARSAAELEPAVRLDEETRIVSAGRPHRGRERRRARRAPARLRGADASRIADDPVRRRHRPLHAGRPRRGAAPARTSTTARSS